jgi:hypothetical protein
MKLPRDLIPTQVYVNTVFQVGCRICGVECLDGETYDDEREAMDARNAHRREHAE